MSARRTILDKIEHAVVAVLDVASMLMLTGLVAVVAYSILARQVVRIPAAWTEEVAAGTGAWLVACGAAVAWSRGAHIVIDTLTRTLDGRARTAAFRIIQTVCLVFFVVTVIGAYRMMHESAYAVTGALRISYSYLYLAIVVGGAAMAMTSVFNIVRGRPLEDSETAAVES